MSSTGGAEDAGGEDTVGGVVVNILPSILALDLFKYIWLDTTDYAPLPSQRNG